LTGTGSANPCMRFDGVNDRFDLTSTIAVATGNKFSIYQVEKKTLATSIGMYISGIGTGGPVGPLHYSNATVYATTKLNATTDDFNFAALSGNNYNLFSDYSLDSTSNSEFYVNNTILNLSSTSNTARDAAFAKIGNRGSEPSNSQGQELILYLSDQLANNNAINTNINSFYGIY
jgi:hypothetical protein